MSLDITVYRKGITTWEDGSTEDKVEIVYENNITHNVNKMAMESGFYEAMWRPDENGFEKCRDILPILEKGLKYMSDNPNNLRKLEPSNGWGSYESLYSFLESYINCCKSYPDYYISVYR